MSEKIKEVVKRMRDRAEARRRSGKLLQIDDRMFDLIADEIEEGAKALEADRDNWRRKALYEDARANATHKDSLAVGNTAAMREALEDARRFVSASTQRTDRDLLIMDEKRGAYVLTPKETLIKIDAALSSPPRNCDIMDWRTAWAKWRTECHPQKPCGYAEVVSGTEQFMDWYMSEAKGETK